MYGGEKGASAGLEATQRSNVTRWPCGTSARDDACSRSATCPRCQAKLAPWGACTLEVKVSFPTWCAALGVLFGLPFLRCGLILRFYIDLETAMVDEEDFAEVERESGQRSGELGADF